MSAYLTYGPVTIEDAVIRDIEMQTVLADDQLTVLYRKYSITFAGHVNGAKNIHYTDGNGNVFRGGVAYPMATAQTLLEQMSQPRQYFKLMFSDKIFLEVPKRAWHVSDSAGGPFPRGIRVTNVAGDLGQHATGGYFLVTGTIEVSVDGKTTSDVGENTYIQGYTFQTEYDIDGDNGYMSRLITATIHGRPEAMLSQINIAEGRFKGPIYWAAEDQRFMELISVPLGMKRKRVKTMMTPDGTKATLHIVDQEIALELGSESPSFTFDPMHSDTYRWSGQKEGAPQSMTTIIIKAQYPKSRSREAVLKQMLYWVCIKGPGGLKRERKKLRFVAYTECSINVAYAAPAMEMTVRMLTIPVNQGAGGVPISPTGMRLTAADDLGDIDLALAPYQGIDPMVRMPPVPIKGIFYTTYYIRSALQLTPPQLKRIIPDGKEAYCESTAYPIADNPVADNNVMKEADFVYEEFSVDNIVVPETNMGRIQQDDTYVESTWMSTAYKTKKGKMRLPTAGTAPTGSTTPSPGDTPKNVETKVHEPITEKVVSWGIQAISPYPPAYPDPTHLSGSDQYTLKHEEVQPAACVPIGPGMYAWTITGKYRYDCLEDLNAGKSLSAGILPTTPGNVSDYNIPGGSATSGRIST